MERVICVSSGSLSQNSPIFGNSAGKQCMAIAAYTIIAVTVQNKREMMSMIDIDFVVVEGDKYYKKCISSQSRQSVHPFLQDNELLPLIRIDSCEYSFQTIFCAALLFDTEVLKRQMDLTRSLECLTNMEFTGFIFTAFQKSVALWSETGCYFLFNSHSVNKRNEICSELEGTARLFKCDNLHNLAVLLLHQFSFNCSSYYQYELIGVKMNICLPTSIPTVNRCQNECSKAKNNSCLLPERAFSVSTETVEALNVSTNIRKRGRPSAKSKLCALPETKDEMTTVTVATSSSTVIGCKKGRPRSKPDSCALPGVTANALSYTENVRKRGRPKSKYRSCVLPDKNSKSSPVSVSSLTTHRGRPKKARRGRPKLSVSCRHEQKAIYEKDNYVQRQIARKNYAKQMPEAMKKAQQIYFKKKPKALKQAQIYYFSKKPAALKRAQQKYLKKSPAALKRCQIYYFKNKPESLAIAQKRYYSNQIKKKYNFLMTTMHKRFKNRLEYQPELRSMQCIATLKNYQLKTVQPLQLKFSSLIETTIKCKFCESKLFFEEKKSKMWCCGQGRYVRKLRPLTAPFYNDKIFLKRIRAYNNLFSFSALGVTGGFKNVTGRGPSCLKIQGRIYHVVPNADDKNFNNTSLYVNDPVERDYIAAGQKLDERIVHEIRTYLYKCNSNIGIYRSLGQSQYDNDAKIVFEKTKRSTHGPVLGDSPVINEMAAIIKTGADFNERQVAIWKRSEKLPTFVSIFDPSYESLQYPLIFPHSEEGWNLNIRSTDHNKMSLTKYVRSLILSNERFQKLQRLSEEYYLDMFCRITEQKTQFHYHNQCKVTRCARRDILENNSDPHIVPGRKILPSSFTGGPRYYKRCYDDQMAIVSRKGKPTFFVTVTCNQNWPEIKNSLFPGQTAANRPDLAVRVFHLKLRKLLNLIKSGSLFGNIVYIMHVIEFQKRGLPHAHIAFRVHESHIPKTTNDVDQFVSAVIPTNNPRLKQLVLKYMIHLPCSGRNAVCNDPKSGKCSKRFPFKRSDQTYVDEFGYYQYKRPCVKTHTTQGGQTVSDQWVVSYNPALLIIMDCHVNVSIASDVHVIKYLFKYMSKGPDRALATVSEANDSIEVDEIKNYQEFRYLSSSEALWRIFEFDIFNRQPTVIALPIHLPGRDTVYFEPGEQVDALESTISNLEIYLSRPAEKRFDTMTYSQFYEQCILYSLNFSKRPKSAVLHPLKKHYVAFRQRGECVARIYAVDITAGEVFYLRILLQRLPARSFNDLKQFNGHLFETYQDSALARGFINNEQEYIDVILEAASNRIGSFIRRLFCSLIVNGAAARPIWDQCKELICEDILNGSAKANFEISISKGLHDIDRILRLHGRDLKEVGLPEPTFSEGITEYQRELNHWDSHVCALFVETWEKKLNYQQKEVYVYVTSYKSGKNAIFINGFGGTGKTLLLKTIVNTFRQQKRIVLCVASTGIAALNYDGGMTAHSMFKIPVNASNQEETCAIDNCSERADLLRKSDLIIWDEATMANQLWLQMVDKLFRDIMNCQNIMFGGKLILFSGDFRQIPPIVKGGGGHDVLKSCITSFIHWQKFKIFNLTLAQRTISDSAYSNFLLTIGEGSAPAVIINDVLTVALPSIAFCTNIIDLIKYVFPDTILDDSVECSTRAILSGTNRGIREINKMILCKVKGSEQTFYSADKVKTDRDDSANRFDDSFLNTLTAPGVPDHVLMLRENCVVILIKNISFADKLVNGTKLIVTKFLVHSIEAVRPEDFGTNATVMIPRVNFIFNAGNSGIEIVRKQYPIKLAYALTINKSQGQTLNKVGVDLRNDVFSHGQLYVALSRVRTSKNIKVLVSADRLKGGTAHSKNIVWSELLLP